MALSRDRKTALIITAAEILRRARVDRIIREIGAHAEDVTLRTTGLDENTFLESLLADTIVVAEVDSHTGNLRVTPR
jgi:hypothetical protein